MEVKFDAIQGVVREKDTPVVTAGNITYKGTKATVADLPQTGNTQGDMWRITADGSEYYWNGTQWEFMGKQVTVDSALDANSTNAVQNAVVTQALNSIVTCMPIPSEAVINGTTLAFCESLAASGKDKAGMMFLGSVRITDTPPGGQADMKVEIISKPAHPEAPQDNDFDTVYRLELNSTNTKERSWVTMYFKSRWPSAVGSPSGNPKAQGWYERVSNQYHLTEDTEVQSGKTYYALQAGSMCYGTTDCPWFSSLMAPAVSGYDSKTKCGSELNKQYRAATEQYVDNAVNTKISTPANPVTGQYLKKTADGWVTDEVTGGGSTWGSIGGDIADQTDLQTVLDGKASSAIYQDNKITLGSVTDKNYCIVCGTSNSVSGLGCLVMGGGHTVTNNGCFVAGTNLITGGGQQTVVGRYNKQTTGMLVIGCGTGTASTARKNVFTVFTDGTTRIGGGFQQNIITIPVATSAYTLTEGVSAHIPSVAPTYTLPSVTDSTVTRSIFLDVNMTSTASIAFKDADGNAITPKLATTPVVGEKWTFLAEWQFGKWQVYGIRVEEAAI